jgi:heme-degrading monooxygenase HmoA
MLDHANERLTVFIHIVRFKSRLPAAEVLKTYQSRVPRYRQVPGLVQKYYLHYTETDEHGAVYVWESREALEAFRASELARSIGDTYQVEGEKDVRLAEVVLTAQPA